MELTDEMNRGEKKQRSKDGRGRQIERNLHGRDVDSPVRCQSEALL